MIYFTTSRFKSKYLLKNKPGMSNQLYLKGFLAILVSSFFVSCGQQDEAKIQLSGKQQSPEAYVEHATFTTLKGDTISVSDYKGKVVLIDFWETWCKPCIASFAALQKLQEEYPENFVVLAVTPGFTNTKQDAKAFAREHDYDFIYAMDTSGLHKKLKVGAIPYKVFIAANGEFIKTSMGSSGAKQDYKKIKKIIEKYSSS